VKPILVWAEMAACSGCSVSMMDNYTEILTLLSNFDLEYDTLISDSRTIPENIDITLIEGGCAVTKKEIDFVRSLRKRSKILVSIGACAATAGVLNYAEGNQMPMPELDAFLPIHDVVPVDYAILGCPPAPESIAKFLEAYLNNDLDYLLPYKKTIGKSEEKIRSIVKNGLCVSCGLCGATCPTRAIRFVEGKPVIRDERCIFCGECYFQCPRSFFTSNISNEKPMGDYLEYMSLKSTVKKIKKRAQSGGTVTSIFAYALDNKILDGAIVAKNNSENIWLGDPIVVTDSEELYETAGTKYSICPILYPLKDAITSKGLSKLGIVGVPCHHQAIQKIIDYPLGIRHVASKIELKIGLFCTSNFRYNAMKKMVEELGEIRPEDIDKIDISAGTFNIYSRLGDIIKLPLKVVHDYEQESCRICKDFTSEFADISIGSLGSPEDWSTVIIRNQKGMDIINGAIDEGYLTRKDIDDDNIALVKKLSKLKKKKAGSFLNMREDYGLMIPFST